MSDPIHIRTEKALAAYIRGFRDVEADDPATLAIPDVACIRDGDLYGVSIYEGRQSTARTYPCVIVAATRQERLYEGTEWYQIAVEIELHTHRNEDESPDETAVRRAEIAHSWRAKALADLIDDESLVKLACNKPAGAAEDARDVRDITIMAATLEPLIGEGQNDVFMDRWELQVLAMPADSE